MCKDSTAAIAALPDQTHTHVSAVLRLLDESGANKNTKENRTARAPYMQYWEAPVSDWENRLRLLVADITEKRKTL